MGVTELTRIISFRTRRVTLITSASKARTATAFGETACDMDGNALKELRRCLRLERPHNK